MRHWTDEPLVRHDVVVIPIVWLTFFVSILIHIAALVIWLPNANLLGPLLKEMETPGEKIEVRLAAAAKPAPPPPEPSPAPQPPRPVVPSKPVPPPPSVALRARRPPVVVAPTPAAPALPAPVIAAQPPPPPPTPPQPTAAAPAQGDLFSYVQSKRRERGDQDVATPNDDNARSNGAIAANLPTPATGRATPDKGEGGGIFQLKRMDYDDAAFEFYGWNDAMRRKTPQLIEVRKGDNPNMQLAVVRRMIVIIREFEKGDFVFESGRRGREFVLSARLSDNAKLEDFLIHEFFDDPRQSR